MSLHKKIIFWISFIVATIFLSFLFTIFTLNEMRKTGHYIAQGYQIVLDVRRIRGRVVLYHDSNLLYWLRKDPADLEYKKIYKERILKDLDQEIGAGLDPKLKIIWNRLEPKIRKFIDVGESIKDTSSSLSEPYVKSYREIIFGLELLVTTSSEILERVRENNMLYQRATLTSSLLVFIFSIAILMLGLYYFRRLILRPIFLIIQALQKIRQGDFSYKAPILNKDEIGLMADTVNKMSDELVKRRKERVEFIGAVAHDLRNPLNVISLRCEMAQKSALKISVEEGLQIIDSIYKQVTTLKRLTNDLLEAAKENKPLWSLRKSFFNLSDLLMEVVDEYKEQKKEHTFMLEVPDSPIEITADRHRISQVIQNLLSNGAKYSPPGTIITARLLKRKDNCVLEISDQGSGIPQEKKESIFQAFSRLETNKDMAEGTGLGLTIVKDIVIAHQGNISVHDNFPKGTTFRIELPY